MTRGKRKTRRTKHRKGQKGGRKLSLFEQLVLKTGLGIAKGLGLKTTKRVKDGRIV